MYNKEQLEVLVNDYKDNYTYYKNSNYNESECRLNFIDQFLKIFGWDVTNEKRVQPQYREVIVESYDSETGRPDYSLTLNGVTKFYIEAKKPCVDIIDNTKPSFQARSYGWTAKHPIAILTNFEYLLIYDTRIMPDANDLSSVALIQKIHFTEYIEKFDLIWSLISREVVYNGDFDKYFDNIEKYKTLVDDVFLKQINSWRLSLGRYLHSKGVSVDIINDETQGFINQIIFLRICEDRKLPTYRTLIETIEDKDTIKEKMTKLLEEADRRYNSGIFKGSYLKLDLNQEVIEEIIQALYYPKSPYAFNIIKADLLGRIYEMFLVEHLVVNEENMLILSGKEENENRDVVSTPVQIVQYMIDKTLSNLVKDKTPEEIKQLRIADIACGSGIFLLEAYEYLIKKCTEWYLCHDISHLEEMGEGIYKLPLAEKKEILTSCIYGVDIDYHACEVAKFTLLLKLLEQETKATVLLEVPVLPDLSENIQMGNALIDNEMIEKQHAFDTKTFDTKTFETKTFDTKTYDEIAYDANPYHALEEMNPFDFELFNQGRKFSVIVGNPPYVKTADMIKFSHKKEIDIYKRQYESAYKQFDRYFLFVERACELLDQDGLLCYFIPNKFAKIEAGKKLRKYLSNGKLLKEYIDFGSAQFFKDKDKTIYSAILFLEKSDKEEFVYREVEDGNAFFLGKDEASKKIVLKKDMLTEEPWILTTNRELMIEMENLYNKSTTIEKEYDVFNGIQTSAEQPIPVYWFSDKEIIDEDSKYYSIHKFGKDYKIEKAILRPYFKPTNQKERHISTYDAYKTNKWIIFPYDREGKLFPKQVMQKEYPYAFIYLKDRYDLIVPRQISGNKTDRDVPYALGHPDEWYQYGRNQGLTRFNGTEKLIIGVMWRDYPKYLFDKKDYIIASGETAGFCGIAKKPESLYSLEFLQAYLMHPLIAQIIINRGSNFDKGYVTNGTGILKDLPLIKIDFNHVQIRKIYDTIGSDTKKIYEINERLLEPLGNKEITILSRQKKILISKIQKNMDEIIFC